MCELRVLSHFHHYRSFKVSYSSNSSFILQVFIPNYKKVSSKYITKMLIILLQVLVLQKEGGEHRAGRHKQGGQLEWGRAYTQRQQQKQRWRWRKQQ